MKIRFTPTLVVLFAAGLLLPSLAHAGDAAQVVGVWKAVASTPDGDLPSVLTITERGGALKAEFELEGMTRRVTDEKIEGDVFRMTVHVDGVPYGVELTLDGDTLDGTWSGSDANGTLKATRQP